MVPKKGTRRAMKEELRGWGIHIESTRGIKEGCRRIRRRGFRIDQDYKKGKGSKRIRIAQQNILGYSMYVVNSVLLKLRPELYQSRYNSLAINVN